MFKQALWATTLIAAVAFAGQAQALKMTLSSGGSTVKITDENVGTFGVDYTHPDQAFGNAGIVSHSGALGNFFFTVNFGVRTGNGAEGGALHLSSLVLSSFSAGTMTVQLEDENFSGGGLTPIIFGIGGSGAGSVTASAYLDNSNTVDTLGTQIFALGPVGGIGFSAKANTKAVTNSSYGLAIMADITHGSGYETTSFDADIAINEPATLGLFGLGLIALGVAARRRKIA